MMRKSLSLFAAVLLVLSLFGACGNAAGGETTGNAETAEGLTMEIMQKSNPAEDDTVNILMIGNSFCYYYVDELYGMAKAAGIKMRVCNIYQSGCTVEQHYNWWKNGESNYFFYTTDENGRKEVQKTNLEYCLSQQNWDVISLQESSSAVRNSGGVDAHISKMKGYTDELISYLQTQFPMSDFYWHQTWAYQIGYDRSGYKMETLEQQERDMEIQKALAQWVCNEYGLSRINSGEAWQIIRRNGYDNLCARMSVNNGLGDFYHEGDIGGGQYLNACIWFEIITGQSCIGNTFRPDYNLVEGITYEQLQQAAHQAVQGR